MHWGYLQTHHDSITIRAVASQKLGSMKRLGYYGWGLSARSYERWRFAGKFWKRLAFVHWMLSWFLPKCRSWPEYVETMGYSKKYGMCFARLLQNFGTALRPLTWFWYNDDKQNGIVTNYLPTNRLRSVQQPGLWGGPSTDQKTH